MRRPSQSLITFFILAIILLLINFQFRAKKTELTVPGTLNTYAMGNTEDYHQYMYILKRGTEGYFLYHNAYSEEDIPDVFLQPFYHVAGFLLGPTGMSVYDIYFTLHIFSLLFLLSAIYLLIQKTIPWEHTRTLALILFISSTGFWSVASFFPLEITRLYLPDFNFDLLIKYIVMQPHHDVATGLYIFAILALSQSVYTLRHIVVGGIAAALLGIIHPYIQIFLFFTLIVEHIARIILMKRAYWASFFRYLLPIVLALPTAGITYYVFVHILQFEIGLKGVITYLPRQQTFYEYVISLGPLLFLSIVSLLCIKKIMISPLLRLVFIWAYLPLFLFFLPDYHLPINTWRLFQTYQHISLAILCAYAIGSLVRHFTKIRILIPLLGILFFLYGSIVFIYSYRTATRPNDYLVWTVDVPIVLLSVFSYIHMHSAPDSVVLAGGQVSNLAPVFTHNKVIIGHNGDNRNFLVKQQEISQFLMGMVPPETVRQFLEKYNVSYIIFGIDAPFFHNTPYAELPFLKEVYVEPKTQFSVVQVLADK